MRAGGWLDSVEALRLNLILDVLNAASEATTDRAHIQVFEGNEGGRRY